MCAHEEKLKHLYQSWKTEELIKAVTIDKAQYEPIALDLIRREIKNRSVTDDDIQNFLEQCSINRGLGDNAIETFAETDSRKMVSEQIQDVPLVTYSNKDIRPFVALFFLPGLYFCLFLSAVVSLFGAGLLIYICYTIFSILHGIPIGIIALIAIGGLLGVAISVRSGWLAIKKAVVRCHAITITNEQAPELFEIVRNLCAEMQASIPNNIVLELGPNFFVTDATVIAFDGEYDFRTLCISAPLLHVLNLEELKAIIGHELAHFTGDDIVYSRRFYPIYRGTLSALNDMDHIGRSGSDTSTWMMLALIIPMWILRRYLDVFSGIERGISRGRELRADSLGAKVSSASTMASALVKVYT
ncbi:MAG TPA: M48 family metallopeptidase [Candidatus Deferrimicrobium sp.]|nr:M48 family metallopeptidase [Candidatus Deferrimicrobium sp.]